MSDKAVPIYLFLGFLEGGKTKFIQKTIANKRFGEGQNILLIVCEEGIEEYDFSEFNGKKVTLQVLDDKSELNEKAMQEMADECDADVIVVEYNGMWHMTDLLLNKPKNQKVFQTVFVADASTFPIYIQNLGNLVIDKLIVSDVVVFNRYANRADLNELHKNVRAVNRRAQIYYEADNGMMIADDIEDTLPFDVSAATIVVKDKDFALWYSDIMSDAKKYQGKTVKFKAMITKRPELPENVLAVGRFIMTCCEEDMQFCWFVALYNRFYSAAGEKWSAVTAEVTVQHHEDEDIDVPLLNITDMYECEPPAEKISTFI